MAPELLINRQLVSELGQQRNLLKAACSVYLSALSFGYMIGYTSPALPLMKDEKILDDSSASWFGSLATFGAMLGCPLAGWLVEKVGRRNTLLVICLPFAVGWGGIFIGHTLSVLYAGRFLTGVASGMVTVTCPMYLAETCPKEIRGMLGSGTQLSITVGILLVYTFGLILGWRALAFVAISLPIVAAIMTYKIPDTPRYLIIKNRKTEALNVLSWLRSSKTDVEEEYRDIEDSLAQSDEEIAWSEFMKPYLWRPLKVAIGIMIFQQFSGINVIMFYTVSIFNSAGFKENSTLATVAIGAVQVIGTMIACLLMDRAGRRLLLLIGGLGMALANLSLAYYYYTESSYGAVAMGSLVGFITAFALGWGPIPMLVMSEIFPARSRGRASAIAAVSNWLFAFIITKEFSSFQSMFGMHGTFGFFGICCLMACAFVWKFVPETKGKSLEDIELFF